MKKLLTILAVLFAVVAMAQPKVSYTFKNDTLNDAETIYLTYPKVFPTANNVVAIAFTVTEVSGAATAVTATLQESVESGKWVDNAAAATLVTTGSPDAASYVFKLTATPCLNYRVKLTQTGTAVSKIVGAKLIIK